MNIKQNKKADRKVVSIKAHKYQPEERMTYQDAMALVRRNRREAQYANGQYVLEQICEQVKLVPEPQLYLMNIYLDSMDIDAAQALVEYLLNKFPRDTSVLTNCATFYIKINDTRTALKLLEHASAVDPRNDKIQVVKARVYRSMGALEDAQKSYSHALKLNPQNVTAMSGEITSIEKPVESPQLKGITDLLQHGQLPDMARAELHFALAKAFSRVDKTSHFRHLNEANRLVSSLRPYNSRQESMRVDVIMKRFSLDREKFPGFSTDESMAPIFVAAMPRSGTTMLEQMLDCHSKIQAIGESGAFANALYRAGKPPTSSSIYEKIVTERELKLFVSSVSSEFQKNYFVRSAYPQRLVDKSMDNVYQVGNIIGVFPKARIIDLRRHPLDLIYSCYQQFFASSHNYAFDLRLLAQRYKNYRRMMDYWHGQYPENILTVSYETLVENPEPVLGRILEFCGLEWEDACLGFHEKSGSVINTASLEQVRKPLYRSSVYQWRSVESYLAPAAVELGALADYTPVSAEQTAPR